MKNKMALIYDFDKTLSPRDMQEFHLYKRLGYASPEAFWSDCDKLSKAHNIDGILAYMYQMALSAKDITRKELVKEGAYVEFFKGVKTWFERINAYALNKDIKLEHYIISSGLKDMILGTPIAKEFKRIYACSYYYDLKGHILWPARVVNYTVKTQYLFRINKGVFEETNDIDLNRSTKDEDKYIPLERMIYFGDGLTDVPSMKVISDNGGSTIAVFKDDEGAKKLAEDLYEKKRAMLMARADYSKNSRIEKIVKGIIDNVASDCHLDKYR